MTILLVMRLLKPLGNLPPHSVKYLYMQVLKYFQTRTLNTRVLVFEHLLKNRDVFFRVVANSHQAQSGNSEMATNVESVIFQ